MIYLIIAILILSTVVIAGKSFAPWVPCWKKDLERIFKLAELKPGEVFYDLGCGDGKTVFYAAENFKATAIGSELALPLFLVCKIKQLFSREKNITFKWKNLFKEDLSKADVIYFFGMPENINEKLKQKIETETKTGTRIISYAFPVAGWNPETIDKPQDKDITIYLYKIK